MVTMTSTTPTAAASAPVDTDLYSRQIGVLGMDTMQKLLSTDVLIIGLSGVGVETAKNVILAGPRSVTVYDQTSTEWRDLSSQFYLTEKDIGKPRAAACVARLAELNRYVQAC